MEKQLNQLSLAARISALAIAPLLIALFFAVTTAFNAASTYSEAAALSQLSHYAPSVSNLVHELQKERGRSAGFIGSEGAGDSQRNMNNQRKVTDAKLALFQSTTSDFDSAAFGNDFSNLITKAQNSLKSLSKTRKSINDGQLSVGQMAGYYTGTIAELLDIIKSMALLSRDADISREITSYIGLLEQKERAGQERAMGNNGFSKGTFPTNIYNRFVGLIEAQNAFMGTFKDYSSAEVAAMYDRTVAGTAVRRVQQMRDHALETKGIISNTDYTAPEWFEQITAKINLLKQVEDFANQTIRNKTEVLSSSAYTSLITIIILTVLGTVLLLAACFITFRSIARPLKSLRNSMVSLADGNLDTHVDFIDYGSEIGQMAKSIYSFKQNARERLKLEEEARAAEEAQRQREEEDRLQAEEEKAAALALEQEEAKQREAKVQKMEELTAGFDSSVNQALEALIQAAGELDITANDMAKQAEGNEAESSAAASAAEETNANVQTVASATEELSASIQEIGRQVAESSHKSNNAVSEAEKAATIVDQLNKSSEKVGEVVKLINDIAEQTNLLALNATIEAARAGDAGKGFAVVAHEVKSLADETAKATEDIAQHVRNIQAVSDEVTAVVDSIKGAIEATSQISASITTSVQEQGAATSEISRSVQEAYQGTETVSHRVETVQTIASQTRNSSSKVQESSSILAKYNEELQRLVKSFLTDVKNI
ncbi:nitrate- and nitrite sensing domain-containing protein [Kordiimonas sp. SCSIO 12603]|uniref:methyl-accepting chemotaxis protein n=1 Tax=Kordiimonas sp. SCSIO 12603 TaxID=2829596 RepID=UPI0021063AFF|nr:nitrate- and nitrite sensing domain-containing protein [Kordiimonas sp. SCSIO 12603]UTW59741.1 nitrate- and nitrite sensing domain-containing protein [Kordiimonas sp. SCSIO 12603]